MGVGTKWWSKWGLPILVSLAVLPFAWWQLDGLGMWRDEVATLVFVRRSWSAFWALIPSLDAVHVAYYLFMRGWGALFGTSAFALRLPSALAVTLTTGLVAAVGQKWWGRPAGLLAAVAFFVLPRTLLFGVEARSGALATLAVMLFVVALDAALERGGWRWWAVGGCAGLAVWLFFLSAVVVAALALVGLRSRPDRWRPLLISVLAAGVACLPLLALVLGQRQQVAWIGLVQGRDVWSFLDDIYLPWADSWLRMGFLAGMVVGLGAVILRDTWRDHRWRFLVVWLLAVPMVVLVAGRFLPIYAPRYLAICAPAFALTIGSGVRLVGRRWQWWLGGVLVVALLGLSVSYYQGRHPDAPQGEREVADIVTAHRQAGDGLLYTASGPQVGSTRITCYAYPESCAGAVDLTLAVDFEHSDRLWESDVRLSETADRLVGVRRVVVVLNDSWPARDEKNLQVLLDHGFSLSYQWEKEPYRVQVWERP